MPPEPDPPELPPEPEPLPDPLPEEVGVRLPTLLPGEGVELDVVVLGVVELGADEVLLEEAGGGVGVAGGVL